MFLLLLKCPATLSATFRHFIFRVAAGLSQVVRSRLLTKNPAAAVPLRSTAAAGFLFAQPALRATLFHPCHGNRRFLLFQHFSGYGPGSAAQKRSIRCKTSAAKHCPD